MTAPTFTRRKGAPRTGYGQVPNGLWTLPVSMGAKVLLGWLHSHTDDYLATLTVNRCRRALGTSSITAWMEELESVGLVSIERPEGKGRSWRFDLDPDAWLALSDRAESGSPVAAVTEPESAHHRAETGAPESARVVDQGENTNPEEHSPPAEPTVESPDAAARVIVDAYWLWVKEQQGGKPPAGIGYLAMVNVVRPFVEAGWQVASIKQALVRMFHAGRGMYRQGLETELRRGGGRPGPRADEDRGGESGPVAV